MAAITEPLCVGNLMSFDPVVVEADARAREAERLMKTYRVSGLPVVQHGRAVGVVSQSDLVVARSSPLISANWDRVLVRHLMTAPAVSVHVATSTRRAADLMLDNHIHRLVVVNDEDQPLGVLSSLDLLQLCSSRVP